MGFEGCVGRADDGAVTAFDDEGGGDGRLDDVGAGCFCDLFRSQIILGERPQGDGSRFLINDHRVVFVCDWGDSGFHPGADDASAVPFLVVVVVAVDEVVGVHVEAVGEQVPAVGERGCCLDGEVGSVGEGDGVSRGVAVAVARVHDLLACEQAVQVAGVVLGGVGVDGVEHGVFSCVGVGCVFLSGPIVACCGAVRTVCRYLVGRALGVVLVIGCAGCVAASAGEAKRECGGVSRSAQRSGERSRLLVPLLLSPV